MKIVEQLKEFEVSQEKKLEQKKQEFGKSLDGKKKNLLKNNEKELAEINKSRANILKKAKDKAKNDSVEAIGKFQVKTKELKDASKDKTEAAVEEIFKEFLGQNV